MPVPPQDLTTTLVNVRVTELTWTDPNPNTVTVRFFSAPTGGYERSVTGSAKEHWAYLPAGTFWMEVKDSRGQCSSPRLEVLSVPADPPPPPEPIKPPDPEPEPVPEPEPEPEPPAPLAFSPLFAVDGGHGRNAQPAFMYAPLPTNVRWDTTIDQAAFQTELAARARKSRWINYSDFTTRRIFVPNDQPLEPVLLYRTDWGGGYKGTNYPSWAGGIDKVCRAGFPVPPDYVPDEGSDKELVLLQPDYQIPQWATLTPPLVGRMFEGWIFQRNPLYDPAQAKEWPNYEWKTGWAGRVCGLNIWPGRFVNWGFSKPASWWPFEGYAGSSPDNPDSTYQNASMGASASGIALADSELLVEDLNRNLNGGHWGLGHCIGLSVPVVGGYRWPAQRSDASMPSSYPIKYGMRLALPAGYPVPEDAHPVCQALIENCIVSDNPATPGYGMVVHEQTNTSVVIKAQPGAQKFWSGVSPTVVLEAFPFDKLQVTGTGWDGGPVPLPFPEPAPAEA